MAFVQAIVLGITQGITEFLPISSDGHLILMPALLGWERFGLGFDVVLHLGTLVATIAYFRTDLWHMTTAILTKTEAKAHDRRIAWFVVLGTIPSVVIALSFESMVDRVETLSMATQVQIVGVFLLVTAALLGGSELMAKKMLRKGAPQAAHEIPLWKALAIGTAQGFAVAPGLSRSGTTIAAGVALGMDREQAARFSFLLSVPIVAAATAKKVLLDVILEGGSLPPLGVTVLGVVTTTIVGYGAISFLLPFVRKHSLGYFSAYTALLGAGILVARLVAA
ncbi:MAG: undecaprenyl-diphosphate phosphatase [Coriobacteriia bacterium]